MKVEENYFMSKTFLGVLFLTVSLFTTPPIKADDVKPPASIWIEAEDADRTNFINGKSISLSPNGDGASGGYVLSVDTDEPKTADPVAPPFFADYSFEVKESGSYRLWIACGPQYMAWVSPFYLRVDKGVWHFLKGEKTTGAAAYDSYYGWVDGGIYPLGPGRHSLRFEVRLHRDMDTRYVAFLDACVFTKDPNYIPIGNHPKYSPQPTFSEVLKGTTYDDYLKKLESPLYHAVIDARTQEKIGPASEKEVLAKLMQRPLPDITKQVASPHEFGLHGMEMPFVQAGKNVEKIQRAYELLARVGVQGFRTAEACWHRLGPNFDNFTQLDYQMDNANRYGMKFLLTVGYPAEGFANTGVLSAVRPEYYDKYRQYLRAVLNRYKDRGIEYMELGNEVDAPDVWWKASTPEMYVTEVKMLKEEIQKSGAKIKTVAFAATYSRDEKTGGPTGGRRFVDKCFQDGINEYADAYSMHYTWSLSEKDFPAYFHRELTKIGAAQKPLLNSEEAGFGNPSDVVKSFARDFFMYGMVRVDYYLARDWFEDGHLISSGLFDEDWNPKLRLLSYAMAVDAMKNRELVGLAEPAPGVEAYVLKYADGIKNTGSTYSIVMWKNDPKSPENLAPLKIGASGLEATLVTGFHSVLSAEAWNLDSIPLNANAPAVPVSNHPVALFCNALPDWTLLSPADWLAKKQREADSHALVP